MLALRLLVLVLLTAALLASSSASAQDFEVEFDGVPAVGQPLGIEVTISGVEPVDGRLFFRPTGATSYDSVVPTLTGNVFRVEIPAEAMTMRGLEVYGEYAADGETHTYPPQDAAANPIPIPVFIGSVTSEVELPPRRYRMVAVPADLGETSAVHVFTDDFGSLDPNRWRLVRWDPAAGQYVDAPDAPDSFAGGTAFWLITSVGGTFDIDGAESTPAEVQDVRLEPGCNQVGNPFAFPVAWEDVAGSASEGIEPPAAFDGEEGYVLDQTVLDPWVGYFVCNNTGETVTLQVPPHETTAVRPPPAIPASYAVQVRAQAGDYRDTSVLVGFAAGAAEGRDRLDRTKLPPVGEYVQVRVADPGGALARSLKPEHPGGGVWELEVSASEGLLADGPRRVTVALDEVGDRPVGFERYVLDTERGRALPVTGGRAEVMLSRDAPERRLRLILGTEAFARGASGGSPLEPVAFALDGGYPNPFAEQTTLRYQLDARGTATLEVFDLLGRRVRVLAEGEHRAGSHAAVWDGRDAAERRVASGVYLVRLRTADATATRRVSVVR